MAIYTTFGGAVIYKPGSYSQTKIDLGGNIPLGPAGLIAIFGEADAGTPGASEIDIARNFYTAENLEDARQKYRSGPIMDALNFLFAPSVDGAIPNGAQSVWVYKTNASLRASLALASSYGTVRSLEWGVGGNRISYKNVLVNSGAAVASGLPPSLGAALTSQSMTFRANGGSLITVTFSAVDSDHDTLAEVVGVLNGTPAFAASLVAAVAGLNITISNVANPNAHKKGASEVFEVVSGGPLLGIPNGLKVSADQPLATITLNQKRDTLIETSTLGGNAVIEIARDSSGGATSASVTINATSITLTDSLGANVLDKAAYTTLGQLVEAIGFISGWSAQLTSSAYTQLSPSVLDHVSTVGAFAGLVGSFPAKIKKDSYEVREMFSLSVLTELLSPAYKGLPDALAETLLAGGAKGATSTMETVTALSKFEKFHVNSVIPLFSRDATADIADNLTDAASTYTIDGIHQAVKTHIALMKTVKKRSERQGYLSFKGSYANSITKSNGLADARVSLVIQDIRQIDATGAIKWFQPWALSCLMAGSRGGASVGLPMTFKFMNCSGIRHTAQPMTTAEQDIVLDFDPDTQFEDAIQQGITFLEAPTTGGFRVVVDNTTYGVDNNWVYNRANVLYAADIIAYNFRNSLESAYVGRKNTVSVAEVKSTAEALLTTFVGQGITVSTGDAPNGYKNLTVRISGNTIYVNVIVKLVEGIDFVLTDITVQRANS